MESNQTDLPSSLCKAMGHSWPDKVSGDAARVRCSRCNKDYIEWICDELGADKTKTYGERIRDAVDILTVKAGEQHKKLNENI